MEADADEGGEADAGDKDGEEEAAEDSLSGQEPAPRASGVRPGVGEEHPPGLGQDTGLGGLVSLLGKRVCAQLPGPQIP